MHPPSQVKVELTKEEPPLRIIANELANALAATMANVRRTSRDQRNDKHQTSNPEMRAQISVLPLEY